MPSNKVLTQKQQIVTDLVERLKNAQAGVVIDYKGINVEQDTALRTNFRNANIKYDVVKNTLLKFAIKEVGYEDLATILEGTTSLATSDIDEIAPAKVFSDFLKQNKELALNIKAGFVSGKVISAEDVKALAKIPSKEILIAQVLGGLNAPIYGLANVLNANIRGLAVALAAVRDKKASGE